MRPKVNFTPEAWIKISDLKEHPRNPRIDLRENPKKFELLKQSIQGGVFEPIVDVIIQRWESLTGEKAVKINS